MLQACETRSALRETLSLSPLLILAITHPAYSKLTKAWKMLGKQQLVLVAERLVHKSKGYSDIWRAVRSSWKVHNQMLLQRRKINIATCSMSACDMRSHTRGF